MPSDGPGTHIDVREWSDIDSAHEHNAETGHEIGAGKIPGSGAATAPVIQC